MMNQFTNLFESPRLAFNVFNVETIRGVVEGARAAESEVYIQASASTVKYYGAEQISKWVEEYSSERGVRLHLDHCLDIELIKECLDAGWPSVMIDASRYQLDENIERTKEIVTLARKYGASVEGEIGDVGGMEDGFESGRYATETAVGDVLKFHKETSVDLLAVGIGTQHGHYEGEVAIDLSLLKTISEQLPEVPLVLHGGTGVPLEQIGESIRSGGVRKINISTELKEVFYTSHSNHLKSAKYDMIDMVRSSVDDVTSYVRGKCLEVKNVSV